MMSFKTGAVLVNYHTTEQVINIAKLYEDFKFINKIVIVNNDTNIEERKYLDNFESESIHIIFKTENLGYSKGNNVGLQYLYDEGFRYVVISNSDISVNEDTVISLIEKLEKLPQYGALAPRMLNCDGSVSPLRKIPLGYKRLFLQVFLKNVDKKYERKLIENDDDIIDQSFLPGCFFVCRMSSMMECNMFDSEVFLYREEEILGERLRRKGYSEGVLCNCSFFHNHNYCNENYRKILNNKKIENISERYFFKAYLNASSVQMAYVVFFELLILIRKIVGVFFRKLLKRNAVS